MDFSTPFRCVFIDRLFLRCQGGTDEYRNLVIVHEDIHRLIHATKQDTISQYISEYKDTIDLRKLNELRNLAGNTEISSLDNTNYCGFQHALPLCIY